jgi:hypothetical protein
VGVKILEARMKEAMARRKPEVIVNCDLMYG